MNDLRKAFEEQIKANPYDAPTRMIFADWLDENGFEDEAAEQRRRAEPEWVEADQWMHNFANELGTTCHNYDESWHNYFERTRRLDWRNEQHRAELDRLRDEVSSQEEWGPITYEDCIKAGYLYLKEEDYFTQQGSETARDMMYGETGKDFWRNWSIITGEKVPEDVLAGEHGSAPFSCSC